MPGERSEQPRTEQLVSDEHLRSEYGRFPWQDDGHRVVAYIDYDQTRLRVECPGEGCKLDHCACGDCEGSGEGCKRCNGTGREEAREGFCWLRDMAPEYGSIEEFYVGNKLDIEGDTRIVYKLLYDEWEWALRREVVT